MSKNRKTGTASTASNKGFTKGPTGSKQKSVNPQQASIASVTASSLVSLSEQPTNDVTFTAAMLSLQVATLEEVITEGLKQIEHYVSQIDELTPQIVGQQFSISNSTNIVEYINLLIHVKELFARILSWMSVITSITYYLVLTCNEQLPDNLIAGIEEGLTSISQTFDAALTSVPSVLLLGITLAPDQKQVSETKATISDVFSRLDKIKQENEEAAQDWGPVEQEAYEAILEGSTKNVSGEEFFDWLSELERGSEV